MADLAPDILTNSLRAKWQAFGLLAVMLAYRVLWLERAGAWQARQIADQLEVCVRAASIMAAEDIEVATARHDRPEDDPALAHLRTIYLAFLALTLFLNQIKQRLAGSAGMPLIFAQVGGLRAGMSVRRAARAGQPGSDFLYFDTS